MAFSFNGIGTAFYGQRDFRSDRTYLTTEWFVLIGIPIIPLRSLRVRYQGPCEHHWYLGFGSSDRYLVYEKHIPHWKQVLCTYGYVALLVGWGCVVMTRSATPPILMAVISFCRAMAPRYGQRHS